MQSIKALLHRPITARDGAVGWLVDVYFDDRDWRVRYLVVDPGRPMPRREVLVPAAAMVAGRAGAHIALTREEIERCPALDEDRPVYLQYDMAAVATRGDPHLRSSEVVLGCAVRTSGNARGRVKDLLMDEERRVIASVVIDTGVFVPGRRIVLGPGAVERIDWVERRLYLAAA